MRNTLKARGARRILILFLIGLALVAAGSQAALAREAPGNDGLAGPNAAPNPPEIIIQKNSSSSIALLWEHSDQTATTYQIWRSENPYFDPNLGQGLKIDEYLFPSGLYGLNTAFRYVDDGSCGYYTAPPSAPTTCRYPQNPTVIVLGDVNHNYFWALRAGNSGGEFDFAKRVGEFDFALVKGS